MAIVFSEHKIFTSESDSECESVPIRQLSLPPSSLGEAKQWQSAPAVVKLHYFQAGKTFRESPKPPSLQVTSVYRPEFAYIGPGQQLQ